MNTTEVGLFTYIWVVNFICDKGINKDELHVESQSPQEPPKCSIGAFGHFMCGIIVILLHLSSQPHLPIQSRYKLSL